MPSTRSRTGFSPTPSTIDPPPEQGFRTGCPAVTRTRCGRPDTVGPTAGVVVRFLPVKSKDRAMKITSKGQVTIPQAVREKAGLLPHSEVEFVVNSSGEVVIRPVKGTDSPIRAAFQKVRGSANAREFKGMNTDEFMEFLRG